MNKSLDNNSNFRRFKKGENLLIGGLSEISKLIANQNNYFKVEKLKEQFLCGDEIVFDDINDFDPKGYHEMVLHTIYLTFEEYEHGFYKKKLSGGINFFTPDKKGAFIEYIYNSDLDEIDKESVISNLNKFKIEFYASEEIRLLYEDISDLMQFIPFIQDISIEKELRLTKLRECYTKLNSAVERNHEVLNSNTSKKHQELCVELINDKLGSFKQSIDKDLLDYLSSADLLNEKKIILEKNKYPKKKSIHSFFINLNDKEQFLEELRNKFDGQKGIGFKILVKLLEEENVLVIESRRFKIFYNASCNFFLQDIGSYASINDKYKHSVDDQEFYKKDIEAFSKKLRPLIIKYKINN